MIVPEEDVETVAAAVTDVSDMDEAKKSTLINLTMEEAAPATDDLHYFPPRNDYFFL